MRQAVPCEEVAFDIHVQGQRLRVKSIAPRGREAACAPAALVFLHEGLGSITQWRNFPLAVVQATGLPALVYDRYGYGKSEALRGPKSGAYLEEEAWLRLPELLAQCGVEKPILVGHSDGATIALLYASLFPESALGVVSEAAHVFIERESIQGIWRTLRAFETTPLRERLERHHGDKVDSMFHGWSDVWLSPDYQDWAMLDCLPAIQTPVLAIQGEEDEYGTPAQVEAILKGVSGPARALLLPRCGHAPHFQARDRVLDEIARFVQEITPGSGLGFQPSLDLSGRREAAGGA
jgi:pimeloyl-ACP methyl ester carboxylesterase